MPVDFLSDEQVARYGRFAAEPSPGELELFFRLDERALTHARSKRAPANRVGWAVQWGAVRMLGAFVTEDLSAVPEVVVRFAAEQVDVDPAEFGAYADRRQSRYEHAWEIRDAYGYREFESAEEQVRAFMGARVWASQEGPRALFDRAVVWLVEHRVLLPGITTLTLDHMSRHTVRLDRIRAHWADMLRVAGSLTTGAVRAYDLIRMLSRDGRPTGLGDAFAHYGRIFKTLHLLQFISDDGYRRMIGAQLNVQEARHRLARRIAFGNRGQLRQSYREGMEDQLGALGLALNAVVWWNSLYLDAAVKQLRADGFPATDEMCVRLSPIAYEHINFLGRYAFTRADSGTGLRPFHDPTPEN
jgi:TnpA family transposase